MWEYGYNYQTQKAFYHANVVNSIVVVNVTFIEQYNVIVFEKGLPNGTGWEMNLIPDVQYPPTYSASTPPFRKSLWTWVPNGTYTLQVGEMEDYQLTPYAFSTQVNVNGSNLNYTIPFNGVKITESGLDNNTSWGLYRSSGYGSYIAGPTTNRSISLYLPAGGLKMRFVADGYYSSTLNFNNDVPNRTVIAHFEKGYNVTFVEHGLPDIAHNSWYVKGFAVAFHGGNSYIYGKNSSTFLVPDGTYGYNISFGQQAWDVNGNMYLLNITRNATGSSFTVDGSNVTVNVYFNAVVVKNLSYRPPVTAGKLVLYAFMGFIAAGVAVEAIYFRRRRI